ncbi:DUF397 domain-containing protein [Streptomyces beigongshangae]|uniref:DUF397 domain-containing protein n=1 Tax=Streptomyces beigongshangae TaxID=2841597 RepID=UPI001C842A94|nr:DUF397 domain-containing protein [Streptomyces sp. REN17]
MTSTNPFPGGVSAVELGTEGWEKPWSGTNGGSCVEAKRLPDGSVAFRQSKDPDGPALVYSRDEMVAFLAGAKSGQADFLVA